MTQKGETFTFLQMDDIVSEVTRSSALHEVSINELQKSVFECLNFLGECTFVCADPLQTQYV